jgi:DNA primase
MLVCEGESDALAVRELLELRAVAAPGASIWKPEWSEYLDLFASLYVVGDGDAAGEAFVWRVCASLPWARPVVMPTGRDLRDLLQAGELERVGQLFDAADEQAWIAYAMSKAPDLETCAVWLGSST